MIEPLKSLKDKIKEEAVEETAEKPKKVVTIKSKKTKKNEKDK